MRALVVSGRLNGPEGGRLSGVDRRDRVGVPEARGSVNGGMLARVRVGVMHRPAPATTVHHRERNPARFACATNGAFIYSV